MDLSKIASVALFVIRITFTFVLYAAIAMLTVSLFTIVFMAVSTVVSSSIIGNLITLIQIWLPFNFGIMITWLWAAATVYISIKLYYVVIGYIERFLK